MESSYKCCCGHPIQSHADTGLFRGWGAGRCLLDCACRGFLAENWEEVRDFKAKCKIESQVKEYKLDLNSIKVQVGGEYIEPQETKYIVNSKESE